MTWKCRYCGKPIKKFIIGWVHVTTVPGIPEAMHVARPWILVR